MKLILTAVLSLALPLVAFAAPLEGVLITTKPENPGPGAAVTVTATLLDGDKSGAVYSWLVDNELVYEAVGAHTFVVEAPALGKSRSVRVLVNGVEQNDPLILEPAQVTIEWEAAAPVPPPFYIGRPLVAAQGQVRAHAVTELIRPNGTRVPSSEIKYTWRINGTALARNSGFGAESITTKPPFYDNPFILSVIAESRDGLRAESGAVIRPAAPDIVVYEVTPLGGLLNHKAIGNAYPFATDEVTFIAYPLNVSSPALDYEWSLNGATITNNSSDPRTAIFKKTGAGTGSHNIGVSFSNQSAFLDQLRYSFLLHF